MQSSSPGRLRASLLAAVVLAACAKHAVLRRMPPPCSLAVAGDAVTCGGAPYAWIKRRVCREGSCRALEVRYADGSSATLYAARSMDLRAPEEAYRARGESEAKFDWAWDISVDAAARRVTFRKGTLLGNSRWSYDLGTGELTRIE